MDPTADFLHTLTWGVAATGGLLTVVTGLRAAALLTRWRPLTVLTGRTPLRVLVAIDAALVLLFPRLAAADPARADVRRWLEQPSLTAPAPAPSGAATPGTAPEGEPGGDPEDAAGEQTPPATTGGQAGGDVPEGDGPDGSTGWNNDDAPGAPPQAAKPDNPATSGGGGARGAPSREPPSPPAPQASTADGVASTPPRPTDVRPTNVYVVRRGDCLWRIAARLLGPGAATADVDRAWRVIYEANRDVIGPDPDLILPGQRLVLPGLGGQQ